MAGRMAEKRADGMIAWVNQWLINRMAKVQDRASPFRMCQATFALGQAASIIIAAVLAKFVYIDIFLGQQQSILLYMGPTLILVFTLYLFFKAMSLYEIDALVEPVAGIGKIWGGLALSFLVLLGILYLFKIAEIYSRGWILCWFAFSAIGLVMVRWMAMLCVQQLFETGTLRRRIALFGTSDHVARIKAHIESACTLNKVGGVYVSDPSNAQEHELRVDGGLAELQKSMSWGAFDGIVIGLPANEMGAIRSSVKSLASYSSELLLCTDLEPFPLSVHGSRVIGSLRAKIVSPVPASENNRVLKRVMDYLVATIGLIGFAPLLALIAIAIKLDSPGPVFFRQRRYGQNNRVFRIFKFRTMSVAEDGKIVKQAERDDTRVTRVGRFLRASSLDELPQLINVMLGDMSIVGPRPHALAHDEDFEIKLDLFSRRRRVLPGLTGWAQVNGYRGETRTLKDIQNRMEYDLYYIDNWSIWFDIEIMVRTILTITRGAH